jgi:acyl-CoA synthetase (AMP-forming)/AMP-acid ligase II/thioesterase domain-containing protein/acyl carrier protein
MESSNRTVPELIRNRGQISANAPAFLAEGAQAMSYARLVSLIDDFRVQLASAGFGKSDRLAVVHGGGVEALATMLGVMGVTAVAPINPGSTAEELEKQFGIRRITGVVIDGDADGPARDVAAKMGLPILEVTKSGSNIAGDVKLSGIAGEGGLECEPSGPDDVALVFATSGTTGDGKIVTCTHGRFVSQIFPICERLELGADDRLLIAIPLYYYSGFHHCMNTLCTGGSVVVLPPKETNRIFDFMKRFDPTWYTGGPTLHRYVYDNISAHCRKPGSGRLRFIRASSGRLPPEMARALELKLGVPVIVGYGMTEAGTVATNPLPPRIRHHESVGPVTTGEIAILDDAGRQLSAGERGEVAVRGSHVFEGYESDAEGTAAVFADGWFRTWDEGYLDEHGYLFLSGRIKEIINCGGQKVHPMEVDAAISAIPGVKEAAAFAAPHPTLGEVVAAAVVTEEAAALTESDISTVLCEKLSQFKIPRRYVFVKSLPRTPTGKVQLDVLAKTFTVMVEQRHENDPGPKGSHERPPTVLEAQLQKIFSAALMRDDVGLDDDFYDMGGDSLRAIELFLEIERKLGLVMPSGLSAEAGTVAAIARKIENGTTRRCLVPIQPDGTRYPLFFVPGRDGELVSLLSLAQALGTDQPFYGFQTYVWLDPNDPYPVMSTKELVKLYVKEIRAVQSSGPYFVGGHSYGGRLAYLVAQELQAAGEQVALLAMIDSYCRIGRRYIGLRQWLAQGGDTHMPGQLLSACRYVGFRYRKFRQYLVTLCRKAIAHAVWRSCRRLSIRSPWLSRKPGRFMNSLIRYEHRHMSSYDGPAVYFKAALDETSTTHPDVHEVWPRLFPNGLDVREVEGDHESCLRRPNVENLAAQLDACLRDQGVNQRSDNDMRRQPVEDHVVCGGRISAAAGQ